MYKATIAIGKMRLEIETQSMKDVFKWSGVYATLPKKCDACGSDNLYLSYRSPKGNDYCFLSSEGISCYRIAKIFNMATQSISPILKGKTWKHLI